MTDGTAGLGGEKVRVGPSGAERGAERRGRFLTSCRPSAKTPPSVLIMSVAHDRAKTHKSGDD